MDGKVFAVFLFPDTFYLIILNLFTLEINTYICE
jgi:hypothetical protein